jgi:predicted nuclease with TOPRIM domain
MSFESFIDSLLYKGMRAKGLSEDFVSAVIEKMNSIQTKVDKLLKELYSLKLASNKKLNKKWREIIKIGNKIAHGVLANISKEQAEDAFEVIVGLIFYVYLNISEDI